jgi:hypothetical protein
MVETGVDNREALGYLQEHWEEMMECVPEGMCCAFTPDFRRLIAYGPDRDEALARAAALGENNPRLLWKPRMDCIMA